MTGGVAFGGIGKAYHGSGVLRRTGIADDRIAVFGWRMPRGMADTNGRANAVFLPWQAAISGFFQRRDGIGWLRSSVAAASSCPQGLDPGFFQPAMSGDEDDGAAAAMTEGRGSPGPGLRRFAGAGQCRSVLIRFACADRVVTDIRRLGNCRLQSRRQLAFL